MAEVPSSKARGVRGVKPATATAKPVATTPAVTKAALPKPATQPAIVAKPPFAAKPKPVVAAPPVPLPVTPPVVAKAPAAVVPPTPVTKPVDVKPVEVPVQTVPVQTKVETKPAPAVPVVAAVKDNIMNDTITKVQETFKNTAEDATAKTTAFMNDANGRAKDAMAKGTKAVEDMVEFSKGNLEAMVASGRVAAKGAEEIAKYSAEYGRTSIEKANATAKQFAAVKSPTEFFQLQGEVAKQALDAVVSEGSKFTENYLKLLGEMVQPIQNRYAVAVEKVKTTVSA